MSQSWKQFAQRIAGITGRVKVRSAQVKRVWFGISIPKLRLSHQLLGFFVLVVLVPLMLLSLLLYNINYRAVQKQITRFTEHTAEATYESLVQEMTWQEEQALLATAYWQTILKEVDPTKRNKAIKTFLRSYKQIEAVALYNSAGKRILLSRTPRAQYYQSQDIPQTLGTPLTGKNVTFYLDQHANRKPGKSPVYTLRINVPVIGAAQPQTVVFFKRFPFLGRLIKDQTRTFRDGFAIVDTRGIILAGPSKLISQRLPQGDWTRLQALTPGVFSTYTTQKSLYSVIAPDEQDDPKLEKVLIKMPHLGWGLVLESPYHLQKSYLLRARTQSLGLVALCIVVIVILGLLYSRGINRNFRQLIKGIKALGEGRYSRKIRLITKSWTPYEVVYLTAEFNRMATQISTAWASIQKLNEELVQKNEQDVFLAGAVQRLHKYLNPQSVWDEALTLLQERQPVLEALLLHYTPHRSQIWQIQAGQSASSGLNDLVQALLAQHPALSFEQQLVALRQNKANFVAYPIQYPGQAFGILLVRLVTASPAEPAVPMDQHVMLSLFSDQVAVAVHQAQQWQALQRANEKLAKLDELKSNLIDTVSHELRTPLTNIKGYTSRLMRFDDQLDKDTKIKSLKVIKQQTDRLSRLVEDLLVIPDIEREGGLRVYPDRVNVADLIQRCIQFAGEKAQQPFCCEPIDPDWDILVDPDRMEQVILNLLDNAIKYAPESSTITIAAHLVDSAMLELQVFNPCEPIAQDVLETLFTKFARLDERLTRTTRGTGLGLFITKGLVDAMGGTIRIEGQDGFRVCVQVPLFNAVQNSTALV